MTVIISLRIHKKQYNDFPLTLYLQKSTEGPFFTNWRFLTTWSLKVVLHIFSIISEHFRS